jgi:hypothetical protein
MREVTIREAMNGYKVQVGCQELVFQDKSLMIAELSRYLDEPTKVEREYLAKFRKEDHLSSGAGTERAVERANVATEATDRPGRLGLDEAPQAARAYPRR